MTVAILLAGMVMAGTYSYYTKRQKSVLAQLISLGSSFNEASSEQQYQARTLLYRLTQELHKRIPHLPEQKRQQLWALIEYIETIKDNFLTKELLNNIIDSTKQFL